MRLRMQSSLSFLLISALVAHVCIPYLRPPQLRPSACDFGGIVGLFGARFTGPFSGNRPGRRLQSALQQLDQPGPAGERRRSEGHATPVPALRLRTRRAGAGPLRPGERGRILGLG